MTDLTVSEYGDDLVVDSRLVASRLGIEHHSFLKTLNKYLDKIESRFGVVRFEVDKPQESSQGGRPEKYALLNENQILSLMSFSRNTDEVVECKLALVEAFDKAKKRMHPSSSLQALQWAVNQMVEQEKKQLELEKQQRETVVRVDVVEQRLEGLNSANTGYHTVRAYCRLNNIKLSLDQALTAGKIAGRLCRNRSIMIGKIPDEAYGTVNSYPSEILEEAIKQARGNQN